MTDLNLLQQYYNIAKYDIDIIYDDKYNPIQKILYTDTRILRCNIDNSLLVDKNRPYDISVYNKLLLIDNDLSKPKKNIGYDLYGSEPMYNPATKQRITNYREEKPFVYQ